jgi:hypothetical protein
LAKAIVVKLRPTRFKALIEERDREKERKREKEGRKE